MQQSHGGLPVGAVRQISSVAVPRLISGVAVPRQISGRRVACPPARRPRCELRSARRLEARPGPAGPAAASNRAGLGALALALPPPTGTAANPEGYAAASNRAGLGALALALPPPTGTAANPEGYAAASNRAGLGALALALPPHSAWEYPDRLPLSG